MILKEEDRKIASTIVVDAEDGWSGKGAHAATGERHGLDGRRDSSSMAPDDRRMDGDLRHSEESAP